MSNDTTPNWDSSPVPSEGDFIQMQHGDRWIRARVESVRILQGSPVPHVTAVGVDGGPTVSAWWGSRYFMR